MSDEVKTEVDEKVNKEEDKKEPKKKMSLIKKIVIGVIGFLVLVIGFTYFATAGAVKTADQFIGYIQDVKPSEAYELFSSKAKDVVPQEDFKDLVDQIGPILNGEAKIIERAISDGTNEDTASKITYKIPGSDGETYVVEVDLVKEDGDWKIYQFESLTEENYNSNN